MWWVQCRIMLGSVLYLYSGTVHNRWAQGEYTQNTDPVQTRQGNFTNVFAHLVGLAVVRDVSVALTRHSYLSVYLCIFCHIVHLHYIFNCLSQRDILSVLSWWLYWEIFCNKHDSSGHCRILLNTIPPVQFLDFLLLLCFLIINSQLHLSWMTQNHPLENKLNC